MAFGKVALHKQFTRGCMEGIRKGDNQSALLGIFWLQVKANGLVVFVPKYGIEGPVYLTGKAKEQQRQQVGASSSDTSGKDVAADEYTLDEDKQTVVSKDGSRRFTVFDKAAVQISIVEGTGRRRQLLLQLVDRSLLPASEQAQV